MADPKHLEILNHGFLAWNRWRVDNPDVRPYLSDADLSEAHLARADLSGADLSGANLGGVNLGGVNLTNADLSGAYLRGADLSEAKLSNANLSNADLSVVYISSEDIGVDFSGVDLGNANLSNADLSRAENLTQEQIDAIHFDPDFPPSLPIGLKLPDMGDNGEKTAHPNTPEKEGTPLRAHPGERIILSGQLATPTAQLRRKVSKQELEELRDLLAACILSSTPDRDNENVLRVAMKQESLDLLRTVVNTGIELHKAPSYPQGLIDALLGLGACLRFFKSSSDWAPLPKALQDKIGSTVNSYDAFLTELGLI